MISMYNKSHIGYLPVRVLQYNIVHQFENTSSSFPAISKEVIKKLGLNSEISYSPNINSTHGCPVVGPCVVLETNTIHLQETFLAYLWCMCCVLLRYTNNLIECSGSQCTDSVSDIDTFELLKYAKKITTQYADWDKRELINPELYREGDREEVEKVNEIFIYAINFVLCHEFAHVELEHTKSLVELDFISDDERKEFELEADRRAVELMKQNPSFEENSAAHIGIAMAACSLLFLKDSVSNMIHPDNDVRISNVIECLEVDENEQPWIIACASLHLWKNMYGVQIHLKESATFKRLFEYMSKQILQ